MPKSNSMTHSENVKITTAETITTAEPIYKMYKKKYVHNFFLMYLKTLMEVGAPGNIGLNAAPPVVI